MKYISTLLTLSILLISCTTPLNVNPTPDGKGTNEITESNGVFTIEYEGNIGGGIEEYVELMQNPETKDLYLSEAAPEDYEVAVFNDEELIDFSEIDGIMVHKYYEPNPNPDTPFSGLDLIFYLKETAADGTETWYGPFQGLVQ
jgi:hypothetical protein